MSVYLQRRMGGFVAHAARALHVAPERYVTHYFQNHPHVRCVGLDLDPGKLHDMRLPAVEGNLEHLPFADGTFDITFCLHVLEHVEDDRRAVEELRRVLRPGGRALIMVPLFDIVSTREYGFADPAVFYHRRDYSHRDFFQRLAPFAVQEQRALDIMTPEEAARYQIPNGSQVIYECRIG